MDGGGAVVQVELNRYQKIEKSLMSGLPNEVDFAINVLTLLSSEGRHSLQLKECNNLVDILLAHAGIFSRGGTCFWWHCRLLVASNPVDCS